MKRTISSPEYHDRLINLVSENRNKLQELKRRSSNTTIITNNDTKLPIIIEDQPLQLPTPELLIPVMLPPKIDTQKNKTKISRRAVTPSSSLPVLRNVKFQG